MKRATYECGCEAAGDLIASHCPMHDGPIAITTKDEAEEVRRLANAWKRALERDRNQAYEKGRAVLD